MAEPSLETSSVCGHEFEFRGPLGTIFREDCSEDVEVRPTEALEAPLGFGATRKESIGACEPW